MKILKMKIPLKIIILTILIIPMSFVTTSKAFEIRSNDVKEGQPMSKKQEFSSFGCEGGNISPHLAWSDAPKGTKSFAITVYDPDAPTGSGWWHWLIVDIKSNVSTLKNGASNTSNLPQGSLQTINDYGIVEFGGACPPKNQGMHRYQFTVWALKVEKLGVTDKTNPATVGFMLNSNHLDKAVLTATYNR